MTQMTEAQRIHHFLERAKKITKKFYLSDGRVTFTGRLNPQTFTATSERNHVDVQTLAGFGRYDFGVKPTHYTLEGFTGIDGFDGPGGLYAMEYFRPMAGKRDTLLMFGYPARFAGARHCYIDSFEDRIEPTRHLYSAFTLHLVEYGPHALTPATPVTTPRYPFAPR